MPYLQTGGPTVIFTSTAGTTSSAGSWYQVHPSINRLAFHVKQTTSSVGATAGSTTYIEVSNDGVTALATKGLTIGITATTDTVSDGGTFASSMQAQWAYIRANLNSLTTSTAGSAGSPAVVVTVGAWRRA